VRFAGWPLIIQLTGVWLMEGYIAAFPATDKRQVSNSGGGCPRWRADGKELYYLSSMPK
jgi:hypothetical protein